MAEGSDSDEKDRQKNESILLWVRNVEMATHQGPHVHPDRGLISNPDLTSFAHRDPTGVPPSASADRVDPTQAPSLSPHHPTTSIYNQSELLSRKFQRNTSTRSASLSLSSNRPSVILAHPLPSQSSPRHKARAPPPSGVSEKISNPIHQYLSKNVESSPADQEFGAREAIKYEEKSNERHIMAKEPKNITEEKKETVLAKDDVTGMSRDEQRLQELRSFARTRQTSLSPLPIPTGEPLQPPTFNLPDVHALTTKRPWLKKKLPTVSGVRPGRRVVLPSHMKLLSRATTSPGELSTALQPQSAPSSPKPSRAMPMRSGGGGDYAGGSGMQDNRKEVENLNRRLGTLERCRSFSHDDVSQLQKFEQLDVGGVSPAASINDEGAPESLEAEGGSSEEGEKSIERSSVGKVESVPSDEAAMRSNSGGLPSSQSVSPVVSDRGEDSDSVNQASQHNSQSTSLLPLHQEDHKKVGSLSSTCPLSPPSLSSPRTPHSPLMRQRHISRSPSPSLPYTPPTSPLQKSWMSGSHIGTESGNVISKQKLKLLNEGQTFSFDTSEDSDFTKVSRQPKFLLKKPLQSCPVSPPPPPPLLSPPSPQHSPGTGQYLPRHHQQHSPSVSADPCSPTKSPSPTQLSFPSFCSHSSVLSKQLLLRRGSSPVSLSQQGGGPFPTKISSGLSSNRSSIHSVSLARSAIPSPQAACKLLAPGSIEESKESSFKCFEGRENNTGLVQRNTSEHQSGPPDKGLVNRQDSGLGTLSTISNKFNL